jgi:hypothetical protein
MKGVTLRFVHLLMFVCCMSVTVIAQSDRGTIVGTVKDPNGAVVAGAKVTITNLENGEVRDVETNDGGNYTAPELKAAPYRILVQAPGFKTATVDLVRVAVQVTRRQDINLEIGTVGESVLVTTDSQVLQTESPVQQTNVTEKQVRELPLQLGSETAGRSPLSFIFLDSSIASGGGSVGNQNESARAGGTLGFNFRVNGGQGLGTEILIDGAPTRRAENGTFFTEVAPGPNAFQEFTVSTAQFSAEFGNSSGGVVNFTVKSGGNDFHGEGYEFYRSKGLDANIDVNRLTGLPKPTDLQHDFGFSIGGPVYLPNFGEGGSMLKSLKNKAFFFFNYGGYRFQQSETVNVSVPTVRMRSGDFSELLTDPYVLNFFGGPVQIFDNTVPCCNRPAIPGNRLDLYRNAQNRSIIDPVGFNIINQLFPAPTGPGVYHNYLANSTRPYTTNYYVQKLDLVLSSKQRLAFSSTYRSQTIIQGAFPRFPEPWVQQGAFNQTFHSQYYRLQHDYTFGPTLLNHFNAGFTRSFVQNRNFTRGISPTTLGMPANATQNLALPLIGFPLVGDPVLSADPRAYQPGGSTFFDNQDGDNAVQFADFVTYIKGKHTLKFGAEARWQQLNDSNHFDLGGNFNFISNQTANGDGFRQGWPVASLITGAPEFSFATVQSIDPGFRFFEPTFFVQDDIKLTSRLTVNIGLRYDIPYPRVEHLDKYRGFDRLAPNPAVGNRLGALVGPPGTSYGPTSPYRGLIKPDYTNWAPRAGFAYTLNSKTVVRGGYGLYYAPLLYNEFGRGGQAGFSVQGGANINFGFDANIRFSNYPPLPSPDPNSQFIGADVEGFDRFFKNGRTAQYSLNIERELPAKFVASIGYVGSKGTRLRSGFTPVNAIPFEALKLGQPFLQLNLADLTAAQRAYAQSVGVTIPANNNAVFPGFAGNVAQALKPFPQYNRITEHMESEGQSFYNAFRFDLNRRFSQGIQAGISYTFAKLLTDAAEDLFGSSPIQGVVQNPYDRQALRTPSPNIVPHSFVVNFLAELPFGKGRRYLNKGGLVDRLVGGWQVSGVQRYRNGALLVPFIAGGSRDFLDLIGFGGNLRPNITGQPFYTNIPAGGLRYSYINPAAFSRPPNYNGGFGAADIGSPAYTAFYADPGRFFGNAAPTYSDLRGTNFYTEDFNILKKTRLTESTTLELRVDFFNAFNRGRFILPEMNLDNAFNPNAIAGFGVSTRAGDFYQPRHIQLGARILF